MRVGVDARTLIGNRSGVGYYLSNLFKHGAFDGHKILAYHTIDKNRPNISVPQETNLEWRLLPTTPGIKWGLGSAWPLWWLNAQLSLAVRRDEIDLFFGPNFVQPITTSRPSVVVVHDLIHRTFPAAHSRAYRLYLRASLTGVLRRADHIVTVSEASRRDLIRFHPHLERKISVAYGAASDQYRPRSLSQENRDRLCEKYNIPERFILYVGTIEPRKNLTAVVEAMERLQSDEQPEFVVVGEDRGDERFRRVLQSSPTADNVHLAGYVEDKDLPILYNAAKAFVYPSLYEGFGLPVLEAMQSGVAVVASNRSSLPEVIGDAGLLFDPEDTDKLAAILSRVWTDEDTRMSYARRGMARAEKFSWKRTADQIADILHDIV